MQVLGKKKRMGRLIGQKRSWKKAIVTLVAGNRIEIAEGV
jgi:large subunit ribosomal protein L23